jgi:hypothetical protein
MASSGSFSVLQKRVNELEQENGKLKSSVKTLATRITDLEQLLAERDRELAEFRKASTATATATATTPSISVKSTTATRDDGSVHAAIAKPVAGGDGKESVSAEQPAKVTAKVDSALPATTSVSHVPVTVSSSQPTLSTATTTTTTAAAPAAAAATPQSLDGSSDRGSDHDCVVVDASDAQAPAAAATVVNDSKRVSKAVPVAATTTTAAAAPASVMSKLQTALVDLDEEEEDGWS